MGGRKEGWMEAKAGLRIAYSNQKTLVSGWKGGWKGGWMGGWMDGSQSRVKDCLQQSKRAPLRGANIKKICEFSLK